MVSHGDSVKIVCLAQPFKLPVAKFPCRHLYGLLVLCSISRGIEVYHLALHTQRAAQIGHEALVSVALLTTQVKVTMHGKAMITQLQQDT